MVVPPATARASTSQTMVSLNPTNLVFSSSQLEQGFRRHQSTVWMSNELRNLYLNLCCGFLNLSITIFLLVQGSFFTLQGARLLLPYMTVAILHWYLAAHWRRWPHCRANVNLVLELCYSLTCTLSMPSWVLHGQAADAKTFLRLFVLGSGVLIGYWCRFLTSTFFATARWIIPMQFVFQAMYLTEPTCMAVQSSEYGVHAVNNLSAAMDSIARVYFDSCPVRSCHSLVYMLEFLAGGLLLYLQYRMEASNRLAFVQGKMDVLPFWPHVPGYVQAVLHMTVSLLVVSCCWVLLQCSVAG